MWPRLNTGIGKAMSLVDIGIITVREDEYRAVLQRLEKPRVQHFANRTYVIAEISRDGLYDTYQVALVRSVEQGPNAGQNTARDLIEDLDPQWLAVVGIGGAIPNTEYTLGDVIIASRLHDFSVGALLEDDPREFADQGGPMARPIQDLVASLEGIKPSLTGWESDANIQYCRPTVDLAEERFYGDDAWRARTRTALETFFGVAPVRCVPDLSARSTASSGNVIKNTSVVKTWLQTARDLALVEMELGGIYSAARRPAREYPILAVRGISDIVGFKRSPDWTSYACHTAAAAFVAILRNMPEGILIPLHLPRGPTPTAALGPQAGLHNSEPATRTPKWITPLNRLAATWRDLLFRPNVFFSLTLSNTHSTSV
jgi:nucleoside phosphorylase